MNNTTRLFLVLVGLIVVSLLGIRSQTNDSLKWNAVTSESDAKDTMLYQAQSEFGETHYESRIYGRDLIGVEKWKSGKELPTETSKILANAQSEFHKQFPKFS